jgi:hypothetical protein
MKTETQVMYTRISKKAYERIVKYAATTGMSKCAIIEYLIDDALGITHPNPIQELLSGRDDT